MSGSVRERRPGVWELRPYLGRDPLTGKKRYASRVVRATGKRDAQAQCDRWAIELADGDESPTAGTFGDLAAQWIAVKERRWPPNTLQEHRRIVARNLVSLHHHAHPSTSSTPSSGPSPPVQLLRHQPFIAS